MKAVALSATITDSSDSINKSAISSVDDFTPSNSIEPENDQDQRFEISIRSSVPSTKISEITRSENCIAGSEMSSLAQEPKTIQVPIASLTPEKISAQER